MGKYLIEVEEVNRGIRRVVLTKEADSETEARESVDDFSVFESEYDSWNQTEHIICQERGDAEELMSELTGESASSASIQLTELADTDFTVHSVDEA